MNTHTTMTTTTTTTTKESVDVMIVVVGEGSVRRWIEIERERARAPVLYCSSRSNTVATTETATRLRDDHEMDVEEDQTNHAERTVDQSYLKMGRAQQSSIFSSFFAFFCKMDHIPPFPRLMNWIAAV